LSSPTIPEEILEAFQKQFGFALLIKGTAGTGKTTLALEILSRAKNPIYISTRVSPEFLYEQFPWVADFLNPSNIYDATQTYFPTITQTQTQRFKVFKYSDVPNFIEIIFEHFQGVEEPTIVIDSWNAVIGYRLPQDVQEEKFSNLITELVRKTNIKLVLVAENPEISFLDYLVDGVIITHDLRVENRRARVMELLKMRSIPIKQPYYTYTLDSGRFKLFPLYKFQFPSILLKPEPLPDPHKDFISTGILDLDTVFGGGLRKGSVYLFEVAHGVGDGYLNFIIPLFTNQLNSGRGVILILPEGYSAKSFNLVQENFVDREQFLKQFISFERLNESQKPEEKSYIQPLNNRIDITFQQIWEKAKNLKNNNFGPIVYFLGLDKLENTYEEMEIIRALSDHMAHIKGSEGDITVILAREGQNLIDKISHMADNHWKVRLLNKALVIYGVQPESEFWLVANDTSRGYVSLNLTPVV